jgi:EpsI family protein
MLFILHGLIIHIWKKSGASARPALEKIRMRRETRLTTNSRFVVVALLLGATSLLIHARSDNEVFPPRESLNSLPAQMGELVGNDIPIDQQTLDILGAGEFLNRSYAKPAEPQNWIDLFIAYFPSQRTGDTIHTPNHCLLGLGWIPLRREVIQLKHSDGTSFPANRAIWATSGAGERNLVIYWFQAHDRVVASEYLSKYYLAADAIRMNRSDGALVRLITPMYPGETPDSAQARILGLGSQLIPQLDRYIPR